MSGEGTHTRNPYHGRLMQKLRIGRYASTLLYALYGLNFLFFSHQSTIVASGGVLATPLLWGVVFLTSAFLNFQSLTRPDVMWLYQIAQMVMAGTAAAWMVCVTIISMQTHANYAGFAVWGYILFTILMRVITAREAGEAFDVHIMNRIEDLWRVVRRRKAG